MSAWCNAVVLVQKKDGGLHFCIDFAIQCPYEERLYPLLRIQEALESLVGAGHFSCLDCKSGFWQIKMEEVSKQYTAFTVGNLGFFECNHMPFGLCIAPTTFQRLMQNCLSELNLIYCLVYLDDIVVFSWMAEEHLHWLHVVFDWFREYNLKLKPSERSFFQRGDQLSGASGPQGRCATQQFEFESNCRMCTAPNLHRGVCLSQPHGPLLMVH